MSTGLDQKSKTPPNTQQPGTTGGEGAGGERVRDGEFDAFLQTHQQQQQRQGVFNPLTGPDVYGLHHRAAPAPTMYASFQQHPSFYQDHTWSNGGDASAPPAQAAAVAPGGAPPAPPAYGFMGYPTYSGDYQHPMGFPGTLPPFNLSAYNTWAPGDWSNTWTNPLSQPQPQQQQQQQQQQLPAQVDDRKSVAGGVLGAGDVGGMPVQGARTALGGGAAGDYSLGYGALAAVATDARVQQQSMYAPRPVVNGEMAVGPAASVVAATSGGVQALESAFQATSVSGSERAEGELATSTSAAAPVAPTAAATTTASGSQQQSSSPAVVAQPSGSAASSMETAEAKPVAKASAGTTAAITTSVPAPSPAVGPAPVAPTQVVAPAPAGPKKPISWASVASQPAKPPPVKPAPAVAPIAQRQGNAPQQQQSKGDNSAWANASKDPGARPLNPPPRQTWNTSPKNVGGGGGKAAPMSNGGGSGSAPSEGAAHPVLEQLRAENEYNPRTFDLNASGARFFIIKSYSEDDIHRSIKYSIWCSTDHGNKRLDAAFKERESRGGGAVYLFFSVNGSKHFCGIAQMKSAVDYQSHSGVWAQDKWKGQFRVRWLYVKDVPNTKLRHIRLENNENKPVTNSRDTQEVPVEKGRQVLDIIHSYHHETSIFDDFGHYEKKQEEGDGKKAAAATGTANGRAGSGGVAGK